MEDKTQANPVEEATINRTKAPQKVEVVVANSSSGSEVNILGELSIFVLRIGFCALMIHHGLEKLQDPQGFAEFVVGKYFPFLPGDPVIWTFGAAITQLVCPVGLALGFLQGFLLLVFFYNGICCLFSSPRYWTEGFPLAVVEGHNYAFELSFIYGLFLYTFYAQVQEGFLYSERLTKLHIIQNQHNLMQKMPFLGKYH